MCSLFFIVRCVMCYVPVLLASARDGAVPGTGSRSTGAHAQRTPPGSEATRAKGASRKILMCQKTRRLLTNSSKKYSITRTDHDAVPL
jgi:hypothetical protein